MTDSTVDPHGNAASAKSAQQIADDIDLGGRHPTGALRNLIPITCFVWAVFQLIYASAIPFWFNDAFGINLTLNNYQIRLFHLSFAIFLAAIAFPLLRSSPRNAIPWYDWALALAGVASCLYMFINREDIAGRAGLVQTSDLIASTVGMGILLLACYRALGLPLVIVASIFMAYVFFGSSPYLPEAIQWKGASYGKAMWHYWMQTEGVFGTALGVSAQMIFLFVLFGAILEKAGAGAYFIKVAFAALGHLRGGPAKAAVAASAMSGIYSGSSIANVVTTGTFTIPLMKKTGFSPEKAGAVEVASSTNGQLTPPVMGAAAFLIAEFTGVPYTDIIVHALVPALVSYIALIYIVHLEALKLGLKGLERPPATMTLAQKLIGFLSGFLLVGGLAMAVYYMFSGLKEAAPQFILAAAIVTFAVGYIVLLWRASRHPDLAMDDADADLRVLPRFDDVAITGLHFLLPIVILIWCIVIERLSPPLSAFWATMAMTLIALTQHPIKAAFRNSGKLGDEFRRGLGEWVDGMIAGSRNMIAIAIATGVAGIIVGTVSLTGLSQVIGEFVEYMSGGSLILMLVLVAIMSLLLGMGLPTTANYIVVSSLMAPVIVSLAAGQGLIIPLLAAHLFVFYFGILADDTPPVGLAAFAGAAISGGDPIKTGVQGFMYDIRTALLPFLFVFNTELLLIDVTWWKAIFVFGIAVIAMMLFAAATQSYFFAPNRWWETVALLLIAFTLFRPGYWLDQVQQPFISQSGASFEKLIGDASPGDQIRARVTGPDFNDVDKSVETTIIINVGKQEGTAARMRALGLMAAVEGDTTKLEEPLPGSPYATLGTRTFDFYADKPVVVAEVKTPNNDRWPKEIFYLPALLLLGLVIASQKRRQTVPAF